jgi:hypothetical protein
MSDMPSAIAEKNAVEAQLASLRLKIARGELVRRIDLELQLQAVALRIRDHLMTAPARHAALLAVRYRVDPARLGIALEQMMRDALTTLADKTL